MIKRPIKECGSFCADERGCPMGDSIKKKIAELLSSSKRQNAYLRLLALAAVAVAVVVAIGLMQNGVAMVHTEVVLDCHATPGVAHTHNVDCYDDDGNLVCPLPEVELHTHDDSCYRETRTLVCHIPEQPAHQHDDSCYDEDGTLVCGLEATEGHTHTDACYVVSRTLTCGLDEVTEEHVHGPGCFKTVTVNEAGFGDSRDVTSQDGANADQPEKDLNNADDGSSSDDLDNNVDADSNADPRDQASPDMPAQGFTHTFKTMDDDGVEHAVLTVQADAPEGALPAESSMRAEWVDVQQMTDSQQAAVEAAVADKTDGKITQQQAVDITFLDAEGNVVEPACKVTVTFTTPLADTHDKPVIVHIDDLTEEQAARQEEALEKLAKQGDSQPREGSQLAHDLDPERTAQVVDDLSDRALAKRDMELSDDQLAFESDQFSTYVVAVTTLQRTLQAQGQTFTVTVEAPASAGIPADAELLVSEIADADEQYATLCGNAIDMLEQEGTAPAKPLALRIAIMVDGQEIEPVEGSEVKVDISLVRSALDGAYTGDMPSVLVNDMPLTDEHATVEQEIQVVHQTKSGEVELVQTQDEIGAEGIASSFTTDSFSDWLLFLDETVDNITIGVNDTLTLRPYSRWIWKKTEELDEYKGMKWTFPEDQWTITGDWTSNTGTGYATAKNQVISFERRSKWDGEIRERYDVLHGKATRQGVFTLTLKKGDVVKTITVNVNDDVPNKPQPVENTADLKVNLFDYDINTSNPKQSGILDEENNKANSYTGHNDYYNKTINTYSDLKFLGWGAGNTSNEWYQINNYTKDVPNQGILQNRLSGGYPALGKSANGNTRGKTSLAYLFDTTQYNNDIHAYPNVNGLFQKDGGYYYYNSNANYAYYETNTTLNPNKEITLYDRTYSQWTAGSEGANAKPIGFFPFHEYDSQMVSNGMNYNKVLNHHFGMSMAVDFEIPSDGLDEYGNPIIFEFSGDDDMWVFIDDNLVLDVGGIHQPVTGSINFSADRVSVYGKDDTTITQRFLDASSPTTWAIGDGKPHTMKIFYLERGGCDSNLSIKFNTPLTYGKGKLKLVKREKGKNTPLPNATFQLWHNPDCEGTPIGTITSNAQGIIDFGELVLRSATDTYYLKETTSPAGYLRDTTVYQVKPRLNGQGQPVKDASGDYIILDVFDANGNALTKLENDSVVFPNEKPGTLGIPVKKTWQGSPSAGAVINLTIKRYKLVDKTQGLTIVQNLVSKPEGYTFEATYTVTNPDGTTQEISYDQFSDGIYKIPEALPGNYKVEQTVICTTPDGYRMTHTQQLWEGSLSEDGAVTAEFQTTFAQITGPLTIKASMTSNDSNHPMDYSQVKYVIVDSEGKKVAYATYAEASSTNGKTFDLPVGTYSVKAVNIPQKPGSYALSQQTTYASLTQMGTERTNVTVAENQNATVEFRSVYVRNVAGSTWKIVDRYNNSTLKSGSIEYPAGTKLRAIVTANNSSVRDMTAKYGNKNLTVESGNDSNARLEYSVEFTVANNQQLVLSANRIGNNQNFSNVLFEVIEEAPSAYTMMAMPRTTSTRAAGAAGAGTLALSATNTAQPPAAPTGKKYIDDGWSKQVTLNQTNSWQDTTTLANLPATDEEGNKYYYYVAAVDESGLDSNTECTIDLQNGQQLLVGEDLNAGATLGVTNKVKGKLQIQKLVTYNGAAPTTTAQKSAVAGTYTFKIFTDAECNRPYQEGGVDKVLQIVVGNDGQAQVSETVTLPVGTYWIEETDSSNPYMFPTENPVEVSVTSANTTTAATATVTNNRDSSNNPDYITLDIEKTFEGLPAASDIPSDFQILLTYTAGGEEKNITLKKLALYSENDAHIHWTENGFTWKWHIINLPNDATGFTLQETHYNEAANYDHTGMTLDGQSKDPTGTYSVSVTPPTAALTDVTNERRITPDNNKRFRVNGNDILLISLTGSHAGTLVVSDRSLNTLEREAIKNKIPLPQGPFAHPVTFYSIEEHQNGFTYSKGTITFTKDTAGNVVSIPHSLSSQEAVFVVTYNNQDTFNNATLVNTYSESQVDVDIVKVEKGHEETHLPGAVFTLRQLDETVAPTPNGTLTYKGDPDGTDSAPTEEGTGKTSFTGLTAGYYEITEKTAPAGYVITDTTTVYFKIERGSIVWLEKDLTKTPAQWTEKGEAGMVTFEEGHEAVEADPDHGIEAADAQNDTFTIENEPGVELPAAGGFGTGMVYFAGVSVLCLGAAVLLRARRTCV